MTYIPNFLLVLGSFLRSNYSHHLVKRQWNTYKRGYYLSLTYTTNLIFEVKVSIISSFNLPTCWISYKDLHTVGLESIYHKRWNPPLIKHSTLRKWCILSFFSLGKLDILFLVSKKVTKESLALELALLFIFLNFPHFVLLFFFLAKELEKPLTFVWILLCSLRILLVVSKENDKVFKIISKLVLITVVRTICQSWYALITK